MAYNSGNNGVFNRKDETKKEGFLSGLKEIIILLAIVFLIRTFGFGLYQVPTGSMETTMLVGERFFADKFTVLFSKINRGDIVAFNDPLFKYSKNSYVRLFEEYAWGPSNWTKRVIGVPGDEIRGVVENGKPVVYINGVISNEPYINKYPLIYVWKIDINEIQKQARNGENVGQFLSPKSYDQNLSYEKQVFYGIKKDRIFINPETDKPVILAPGTPLEPGKKVVNGENYWNNGDDFYVKLGENQYWMMGDNRLGSLDSRFFGPIDGRLIHGKILFRIWSVDSDENWWILDLIKHPIDFIKRIRFNRFFQVVR